MKSSIISNVNSTNIDIDMNDLKITLIMFKVVFNLVHDNHKQFTWHDVDISLVKDINEIFKLCVDQKSILYIHFVEVYLIEIENFVKS